MKATILIVDDEQLVRRVIGEALTRAGYHVETAANGTQAIARLSEPGVDLLLLDLQLGDIDGVTVMQFARRQWPKLPVIMLTAHGSLPSAIASVRSGAFDYLLKPVSIEELRERIREALEQHQHVQTRNDELHALYQQMHGLLVREGLLETKVSAPSNADVLQSGPLLLHLRQHTVNMGGEAVPVTPSEFAILAELLRQPGSVVSCIDLVRATNTVATDEEEARQLVRPHIVRLRRKLEADPQQPCYLISVRGVGYRWVGDGTGVE